MKRCTERMEIGMGGGCPAGPLNPFRLTDDPPVVRILYEIRKEGKLLPEIAAATGLDESYVQGRLEECKEVEIVGEEEGKYVAKFIFLDREEKGQVRRLAEDLAGKELSILSQELPGFISAFNRCSFERQGYDWERMSHIMVGAHLTDMAVMERGFRNYGLPSVKSAPERPGGGRYWLEGVEGGTTEFEFANHIDGDAQGGWGIFFCPRSDLRPKHTWLQPSEWKLVWYLMTEGSDTIDALVEMSGESRERVEEHIENLVQWEWLSKTGPLVSVRFPIFYPEDLEIIVDKVDRIGTRIVEEVYVPSLEAIGEAFYDLRKDLKSEYGGFVGIVLCWTRELCLARLMKEGVLAALPSASIQQNWGWIGKFEYK